MENITLYDYLQQTEEGEEITVHDKDYDTETYFYKKETDETDSWSISMETLSKLLTITKIRNNSVEVNLSKVIGNKLQQLEKADLFISCDIDDIMDDIDNILSGNVSEEWFKKFVCILDLQKL